jgi:uncharacterized protein YcfJ
MRYMRGFIHGTVVGTIAGLCLAPQEGAATRARVRGAAGTLRGGLVRAQGTATRVAPAVESTRQRVIVVIGRARRPRQRDGAQPQPAGGDAFEPVSTSGERPQAEPGY